MKTNQNNEFFPHIMRLITARWISEPLFVAAKLDIAGLLSNGPLTIDELAEKTGSHTPYLFRVLRALASLGVFEQTANRTFNNTPLSTCLKTGSLQPLVLFFLSGWHNRAWGKLYESVKTGNNAFLMAHKAPVFRWLADHPGEAEIFYKANALKIENLGAHILNSYDFSPVHSITDIGGGTGTLLIKILQSHPHITGRIADLPFIIKRAKKSIKDEHLENRCTVCECDFLKAVPKGSELFIMSNILHDWDDKTCSIILKNCRKAMDQKNTLLLLEMILTEDNKPSVAALLDLEVLVMGGGKERTQEEFQRLLSDAGFRINRIIDTGQNEKLLECKCKE